MKTLTQEDTCIPMFSATLFTKATIWKEPEHPVTNEKTFKMWDSYIHMCCARVHTHTHTHTQWNIIHSLKRMRSCHLEQHRWTSRVMLSEKSQTETNTKWSHLHVEFKNKTAKNISLQIQKTDKWLPEMGERVKSHKIPIIKSVSHRDIMYSMVRKLIVLY